MAWAKSPPGHVPCYTFGGAYRESADVRIAREIALACGQPHETLVVGDEFFLFSRSRRRRRSGASDRTMDVTGSAEHFANALARRIAPVRVTENYGSELMREHRVSSARSADRALRGVLRGANGTRPRLTISSARANRCRSSRSSRCPGTTIRGSRSSSL